MRIAAISHSCVIDVNQQVYSELLRHDDVELMLIAPESWYSSLRGDITFAALPALAKHAAPMETRLTGQMHLHYYTDLWPPLSAFGPDILYVDEEPYSLVASQALAASRRLGCKLVFYTKQNLFKRYMPPFGLMQSRVLRAADHAMVVSEEAGEVLRRKGYKGQVTELPHGIDPDVVCPSGGHADLLERLGVEKPIVGYVGRIASEKGVWDLLKAADVLLMRRGVHDFTVLVIGDGPDRWKLEAEANRTGAFCFTGAVAHHAVPDYLSVLDMLVLPSRTRRNWKEQFGRVLVEALACGVPLVGSTSGHIPALIEKTGGGLVFREGDVTDLADKIETLLDNPEMARQFAESGRAAALRDYSYGKVADTLYRTLSGLM